MEDKKHEVLVCSKCGTPLRNQAYGFKCEDCYVSKLPAYGKSIIHNFGYSRYLPYLKKTDESN